MSSKNEDRYMDHREVNMYKLQDIIEDLLRGETIKGIAKSRKISKNTVKKYRSILEQITESQPEIKTEIEKIMKEFRQIRQKERHSENFGWLLTNIETVNDLSSRCENLVRLNEVLNDKGFHGSYSSLIRFMAKHKKINESPVIRIETKAGEIAQVDFGYVGKICDEDTGEMVKAYVFAMVLGFSRDAYYEIVKSQDVTTWINCHIHAFEHFGGVPAVIIPDNLKSAIIKASYMEPMANRSYADLAKHYGFQIDPCIPATPEHKGKVESGVKYVKNNFVPLRSFKNFTDSNSQLAAWNKNTARERIHGTTRRKPSELFEVYEKERLLPVSSLRFEIPIWKNLKVDRDIHIQFDRAYYSAPHELRGEHVWARKTWSQVAIFHENELIAVHFPAQPGQRRTKKEHYPPDKTRYMEWDTSYCMKCAFEIGEATFYLVNKLLNEEPIRNLRSAQNIIRLEKKYTRKKLDDAVKCAISFGSFTYHTVKNILEKDLDTKICEVENTESSKLDASYARDLKELLNMEEQRHGNLCTNKI
jgi:transposase